MITLKIKKPVSVQRRFNQVIRAAKKGQSVSVDTDEILLLRLQIAILKGELDASQIRIVYPEDETGYAAEATLNDRAVPSCWPPDIFRENMPFYMQIVELRHEKQKAEEKARRNEIQSKVLP